MIEGRAIEGWAVKTGVLVEETKLVWVRQKEGRIYIRRCQKFIFTRGWLEGEG